MAVLTGCASETTPEPTPALEITPTVAAPTTEATPSSLPPTPTAQPQGEETYPAPGEQEGEAYPLPEGPLVPEEGAYPAPEAAQARPAPTGPWVFDGQISEDEYSGQLAFGRVTLYWGNDAHYLYLAAEAETEGWLGVGVDPEDRMQGADYIIATFDGEAQIWDAYGQAPTGATHPPDTELGGTMDILEWAAVQDGPLFRFEALRPLDSGDAFDKALAPGQTYDVLVAVGSSVAFDAPHVYSSQGQITLD